MVTTNYALAAEARDRAGKGVARALRREDKIPAVIYGGKQEPAPIAISAHDMTIEYHKGGIFTKLCEIEVAGKKEVVLARDVQTHPVSDKVMHVDFLRVTDKTKIVVSVPVKFINQEECPGIQRKAVLNMVRHTVDLVCSAKSIPSEIEVNLAGLNVGDTARYSNAVLPTGAEFADTDRDYTIMTLVASRAMASAAGASAAEGSAEGEAEGEGEAEEASEE